MDSFKHEMVFSHSKFIFYSGAGRKILAGIEQGWSKYMEKDLLMKNQSKKNIRYMDKFELKDWVAWKNSILREQ
jgi:hypothetical protein